MLIDISPPFNSDNDPDHYHNHNSKYDSDCSIHDCDLDNDGL